MEKETIFCCYKYWTRLNLNSQLTDNYEELAMLYKLKRGKPAPYKLERRVYKETKFPEFQHIYGFLVNKCMTMKHTKGSEREVSCPE